MDSVIMHEYPPVFKAYENHPESDQAAHPGREIRAMVVVNYRVTFTEKFELHSFPFDVQGLHVKLQVEQEASVEMVTETRTDQDERMSAILCKDWMITEWKFLDFQCRDAQRSKGMDGCRKTCVAHMFLICKVQRYARSYLIRTMGVVLMICLLSSAIFVIDPAEAFGEMVGHSFMMLLTLTTYSLVVADILPVLGYLTLLDNFVLVSFAILAMVVVEVAFIGVYRDYSDSDDAFDVSWWTHTFAFFNISLILTGTFLISLYVKLRLIPKEIRKPVEDPEIDLKQTLRVF